LIKSNEGPDPLQKGIAFMRPMSAPGYIIARSDTVTPSQPTPYNAPGARLVTMIPKVAIEKMRKRERLMAPIVSGDLRLKNALCTRHGKVDSAISTNMDIHTKTKDADTPPKEILPPKIK
jgi:hypothetical protein